MRTCTSKWHQLSVVACLYWLALVAGGKKLQSYVAAGQAPLDNQDLVGVAYSNPASGMFLGSPSILVLPNGSLLASHDTFGAMKRPATYVYQSDNGGESWAPIGVAWNQYWSSLFEAHGLLYLLGTTHDRKGAGVAISMSEDGGASWKHAVLFEPPPDCAYATGPVPVTPAAGFLWRGMELWCGEMQWPQAYNALLLYAPDSEEVDLLDPSVWRMTEKVQFSRDQIPAWMPGPVSSGGFLEGNAVATPEGGLALLLRCRVYDAAARLYTLQYACMYRVVAPPPSSSAATMFATHMAAGWAPGPASAPPPDSSGSSGGGGVGGTAGVLLRSALALQLPGAPAAPLQLAWEGFVSMPGGGNKFVVRRDPASGLYLSLTNPSVDRYGANGDARNILTLVYSPNLLDWRIATTVLVPNDGLGWDDSLWRTGYHYADWQFDGDDLVAAIRTAWDGAHNFHDANWLTFKRIEQYRQYLPDSPSPEQPPSW